MEWNRYSRLNDILGLPGLSDTASSALVSTPIRYTGQREGEEEEVEEEEQEEEEDTSVERSSHGEYNGRYPETSKSDLIPASGSASTMLTANSAEEPYRHVSPNVVDGDKGK